MPRSAPVALRGDVEVPKSFSRTWAAAGVALTAIGSRVLFGETLTRRMAVGITLIMVGVLLLELGGGH